MRAAVAVAAVLCCAGCPSFLPDSNPPKIRYFTVDPPAEKEVAPAPGLELRLARVDAASHIEDRIAFRDAGAEVGYYGSLRWSDPPEDYLRRALARSLFEDRQLREIVSGAGPALELELHAFEEVKEPRHAVRIAVTWRLRDARTVIVQRTLTVEQPVRGPADAALAEEGAAAIATAMAVALREVVDSVVAEVVAKLALEQDATASRSP
jgi:ABC-type uncharacterized transport system auxiliary subunit